MPGFARNLTTAVVAISLCSFSIVAPASVPAASATASPTTVALVPSNQWITLSALTTRSSSASSVAAAQGGGEVGFPPDAPLVVILATIATAVYLVLRDDDSDLDFEVPVSPS